MASILNVDQINNAAGTSAVTIDPSTGHATFPNGMTLPAGSVVQVQTNYGVGGQGSASTTFVDINVSVTITPKRTNSLLIVQFFATAYVIGSAGFFSISRDGTLIGNAGNSGIVQMHPNASSAADYQPSSIVSYVTSGSTSTTTFKVAVKSDSGQTYFPAGSADQWSAYAWEIAQ